MEWRPKPAMLFTGSQDPTDFGVVFPFSWSHGASRGQGYVVFRPGHGRMEPVGLSLGDPGTAGSVIPNERQPRVTTSILRVLPLGVIVAEGMKRAVELRDASIAAQFIAPLAPMTPDQLAEAEAKGVPLLHMQGGTMMNAAEAASSVAWMAEVAAAFPTGSGSTRGGPKPLPDAHYRNVAQIYGRFDYPGGNPVQAIREMYRQATGVLVPRSTASRWVRRAEKKGLLGAAPGPGRVGRGQVGSSEAKV